LYKSEKVWYTFGYGKVPIGNNSMNDLAINDTSKEPTFQPETPSQRAKDMVHSAKSVVVLLPEVPSFDQVAAATSLVVTWLHLGKDVVLACQEPLPPEALNLVGSELCKQQLANQNVTITFPYEQSAVDKVSYHISEDQQKFTLVIKPQKGAKPLDASKVSFGYLGVDTDLIFLVGVHSFDSLGPLFEGNEDVFQRATTVVLHTFEPEIGLIKLNIGDTSSFAEGTARLMSQWHDSIPADAASNLLAGIYEATDSLHSWAVTAETFDTIAWLLRQGGRRPSPAAKNVLAQQGDITIPAAKPFFAEKTLPQATLDAQPVMRPTNPLASAMMSNTTAVATPARVKTNMVGNKGGASNASAKKNPKNNKTAKNAKKSPQPGDLDYNPSGFGPGGNG
jgi:hypothetical protein